MIYYSVLDITPSTDKWIEGYVSSANRLVSKHGGKFLARTTSHEQLEGKVSEAAFRTIIEWPSKEDALAFMKDPEYIPQLEARTKGSTSNHYLIAGKDELK